MWLLNFWLRIHLSMTVFFSFVVFSYAQVLSCVSVKETKDIKFNSVSQFDLTIYLFPSFRNTARNGTNWSSTSSRPKTNLYMSACRSILLSAWCEKVTTTKWILFFSLSKYTNDQPMCFIKPIYTLSCGWQAKLALTWKCAHAMSIRTYKIGYSYL